MRVLKGWNGLWIEEKGYLKKSGILNVYVKTEYLSHNFALYSAVGGAQQKTKTYKKGYSIVFIKKVNWYLLIGINKKCLDKYIDGQ